MPADDPQASDAQLLSVADYERAAGSVLDPSALAYYAGGAGDEITLRDNVLAWRRLATRPRVLVGVGERDPSVTASHIDPRLDELDIALALAGAPRAAELNPSFVTAAPWLGAQP